MIKEQSDSQAPLWSEPVQYNGVRKLNVSYCRRLSAPFGRKLAAAKGAGQVPFALCCLGAAILGFVSVTAYFYFIAGNADALCEDVQDSFSSNDMFSVRTCAVEEHGELKLELDLKKEMQEYFMVPNGSQDTAKATRSQKEYYCSEILGNIGVDGISLFVYSEGSLLQKLEINDEVCR